MSNDCNRQPLIVRFYYRFVEEGNAAQFVRDVSTAYTSATLQHLARRSTRAGRRGAVLALTMVGGGGDGIVCVGEALQDADRGVRMIAEQGLPAMWDRAGSAEECQMLRRVQRFNAAGQYTAAIEVSDDLLRRHPVFGAAWHQRSSALSACGHVFEAIADNQRALECEPYLYPAALEMANSFIELGDHASAKGYLQWALRIHPHCELARLQLLRLQRDERKPTDR